MEVASTAVVARDDEPSHVVLNGGLVSLECHEYWEPVAGQCAIKAGQCAIKAGQCAIRAGQCAIKPLGLSSACAGMLQSGNIYTTNAPGEILREDQVSIVELPQTDKSIPHPQELQDATDETSRKSAPWSAAARFRILLRKPSAPETSEKPSMSKPTRRNAQARWIRSPTVKHCRPTDTATPAV